jgi:uncharacterized membrane protein YoaK (UPF0700 family)
MSQRLPLISLVVGVLAGDLTYRLVEFSTYQVVLVTALVAAGALYLLSGTHELIHDGAFPLVGGLALSAVVKWVFATMLS